MARRQKNVTLKDLAQELDLSQAIISRALRGDKGVREETRNRVREAANKFAYQSKIKAADGMPANEAIENHGDFSDARFTIYDIARLANVSAATVSRALNDSPKVKEATKLKIQNIASLANYNFSEDAKILTGKKVLEDNTPTIYDVARRLNLSPATVSRCLREREDGSSETAMQVKKTATAMGYTPDLNAAHLRGQKIITIGVFIPKFSKHIDLVLQGMDRVARNHKINLVVNNCFAFKPIKIKQINFILKFADGIIIMPGPYDDLKLLINEPSLTKTPTVCLGSYQNSRHFDTVTINPFNVVYEITSYLIKAGNKAICFIDPIDDTFEAPRICAFKQALHDHNLPFEKQLVIQGGNYFIPSSKLVDTILSTAKLPDAIILINCSLDEAAEAILQNAGIDISERLIACEFDVGLVRNGFSQSKFHVSYDFYDLGEKGMIRLIEKIDAPASFENKSLFSKHVFNVRPH